MTGTSLPQKTLKESFILEAIKPESTLGVCVYSAFTCLFSTTVSGTSYRLFCIHIVANCYSVQKYSLPLPKGELCFLWAVWPDLANRRWEVMYIASSSKGQALLFLCPDIPGRSVSLSPKKRWLGAEPLLAHHGHRISECGNREVNHRNLEPLLPQRDLTHHAWCVY